MIASDASELQCLAVSMSAGIGTPTVQLYYLKVDGLTILRSRLSLSYHTRKQCATCKMGAAPVLGTITASCACMLLEPQIHGVARGGENKIPGSIMIPLNRCMLFGKLTYNKNPAGSNMTALGPKTDPKGRHHPETAPRIAHW